MNVSYDGRYCFSCDDEANADAGAGAANNGLQEELVVDDCGGMMLFLSL